MKVSSRNPLLPWAGLIGASAFWAAAMQLGQILPYPDCSRGWSSTLLVSLALALASASAAWISWRVAAPHDIDEGEAGRKTERFCAMVSALGGAIITFAVLLQGLASALISGCLR